MIVFEIQTKVCKSDETKATQKPQQRFFNWNQMFPIVAHQ